ncbi:hypothetical protein VF06_37445 [Nostoc linckia z4]|uniref:Uncharacterized protein n=1 Tax=Nostoc linckia z8 TaxID=1628746 RepID=A0A9Q5ZAX7_NOSLI|nr:hypothetical protein [Nostoc linckia]PHJ54505.1 hypothetical protein VF02_36605 [Nostoc linckia z1]PHJ69409.1 hypothetical protein VF03_24020 [Nostoc linckia z2]PHJ70858.1 hypothetical protein VF06_37445 [Nostoc linckia z4]PHJ79673.1 hypothetical protein VF07_33355 [Nostoc linckia z6]PHK02498.1 hypothetical protein VF08_18355 [Nostoc linckia z8]
MANVADLTFAEISAKISDSSLKTWWDDIDALPNGIDTAEMFAKLLQAAYVAQVAKNVAAGNLVVGEALNAYPAPTTGTVQTITTSGLQFYNATYGVNIVAAVDLNTTTPARV